MDKKRIIDFAIIILCAFIIGIAAYSASDLELGMMVVFLAGVGFIVFLFLFLRDLARLRITRGEKPDLKASITELLLLNEEDQPIASWDMYQKTSLVIGKDIRENHVDVNLNQSVYASMIDIEHAVLNYADHNWYIEDLGSKNGIVLLKKIDGRKYKLAADQPCKIDAGDVIIIGLTKLLAR